MAVEGYLPNDWSDDKDLGLSPSVYYSYEADRVWWYSGARATFRMYDFRALPQYYTLQMEDLSVPSHYELNNRFIWSGAIGVKSKRENKRFQFYGEIAVLYTLEYAINSFYEDDVGKQYLTRRIYRTLRPEVSIGMKF